MAKATKKSTFKVKVDPVGEAHIKASFNNAAIAPCAFRSFAYIGDLFLSMF